MKTTNRTAKAIAIALLIGLGIVHNNNKSELGIVNLISSSNKYDELHVDTISDTDHKIYTYTKETLKTSIQHLISNL